MKVVSLCPHSVNMRNSIHTHRTICTNHLAHNTGNDAAVWMQEPDVSLTFAGSGIDPPDVGCIRRQAASGDSVCDGSL